jgi:hypothetical protein
MARQAAGKHLNVTRAWGEWYDQVLDMRYADMAGFACVDLPTFYRQSVEDLEKIPLRKSYALDLYDMVYNLTSSMSFYNTIAYQEMSYKGAADRLAAYGVRLFNWMEDKVCKETGDCGIIAGFLSPMYKGLGLGYNRDSSFGLILFQLLDSQLPDGSWQSDPLPENAPDTQTELLFTMYRATWACIDAIRPMRNDISNTENATLGLI